jgi:hypothetical protein
MFSLVVVVALVAAEEPSVVELPAEVDAGAVLPGTVVTPSPQVPVGAAPVPAWPVAGLSMSGAATAGIAYATFVGTSSWAPEVAARFDIAQQTNVGTVRAHLSTLLPDSTTVGGGFDLGSYLEFEARGWSPDSSLTVRLQPFNSSTRLVSFDWANAQGRAEEKFRVVPVLSVDLRVGQVLVWGALRGTLRESVPMGWQLTKATFDGFLGTELRWPGFKLEARAAYLSWGNAPGPPGEGLLEVWSMAGAARATWSRNDGVDAPLDLATYRNDPLRMERLFEAPTPFRSAFAATVSVEGGAGVQQLLTASTSDTTQIDPTFSTTQLQPSGYGDVQVRLRFGATRLFLIGRLATTSHVQFDAPGLPPLSVIAATSQVSPQVTAFVGADHQFSAVGLTPGMLLSLRQPATVRSLGSDGSSTTIALTGLGQLVILPADQAASPQVAATASLRWNLVAPVCVLAEVDALLDWNNYDWNNFDLSTNRPRRHMTMSTRAQLLLQGRF